MLHARIDADKKVAGWVWLQSRYDVSPATAIRRSGPAPARTQCDFRRDKSLLSPEQRKGVTENYSAVALSFTRVAAGQVGRPLRPNEIRNYKEPEVDSKFSVFEDW